MKRLDLPIIGGAALAFIVGCGGPKNVLEPAPTADTAGEDTAVANVDGATIRAEVDAWDGAEGVLDEVTPVRVAIVNESGKEMRLQYRDFVLVAADGTRYPALPPFQIEGEIERPVAMYDPIAEPGFYYDGFAVNPYYGAVYPGIGVYDYGYDYDYWDRGYYDTYYPIWAEIRLPTERMVQRALPEGVIMPGGKVTGFLYFQKVPADAGPVTMKAELIEAVSRDRIGTATIPFVTRG